MILTAELNDILLSKNIKVGHVIQDQSKKQYEIVDFDENDNHFILRLLPNDERVKPEFLVFYSNFNFTSRSEFSQSLH